MDDGKTEMRIAIIGSGISGMVAAYRLHESHEITVFEANDYIGGHTNTVDVELDGKRYPIDTGFIVFNHQTYPNFLNLINEIGVKTHPSSMSFSVQDANSGLEYNGESLNKLFAQRRNLFRPTFYRMVMDILRFNRTAIGDCEQLSDQVTVNEFIEQFGYSKYFANHYLLPMGAAIWSCPIGTFGEFPIGFIVEFYKNHGLLQVTNQPTWYVIQGGSKNYVSALTRPFQDRIHLSSPVQSVRRRIDGIDVRTQAGSHSFDEVIFACHSDQALSILDDPSELECDVLTGFPYSRNTAILHTDENALPSSRRAWAAWNYRLGRETAQLPTVTYNMNILQSINSEHTFCVTLNNEQTISADRILSRHVYHHPVFTVERKRLQSRHSELIRTNRTSYCGAYWGNGFHEDGVNSGLAVARAYENTPDGKTPAAQGVVN